MDRPRQPAQSASRASALPTSALQTFPPHFVQARNKQLEARIKQLEAEKQQLEYQLLLAAVRAGKAAAAEEQVEAHGAEEEDAGDGLGS
jgi:uncharacterized protein YPO0396